MAFNKLTDFSETASDNVAIDGVGIQGTSTMRDGDDAFRALAKLIARSINGTDPVKDSIVFGDPSDLTKGVRIDAGNVTAGQTRVLSMPDANVSISAFMAGVLDDADAAAARTTLGVEGAYLPIGGGTLTGPLNLTIGTAPADPAAGLLRLYALTGGLLSTRDEDGVVSTLLAAERPAQLSAGYTIAPHDYGGLSGNTINLDPDNGNAGLIEIDGSGTIAAPTASGIYTMVIELEATGTGTVTFSGFDEVDGDSTPASGDAAILYVTHTPGAVVGSIRAIP